MPTRDCSENHWGTLRFAPATRPALPLLAHGFGRQSRPYSYDKDDLESRPTGLRGAGRTATAIAKSNRGTSPINRGTDASIISSPPILGRSKDPRFRRRIIPRTGWCAAGAG